jgi:hypothetical protein
LNFRLSTYTCNLSRTRRKRLASLLLIHFHAHILYFIKTSVVNELLELLLMAHATI